MQDGAAAMSIDCCSTRSPFGSVNEVSSTCPPAAAISHCPDIAITPITAVIMRLCMVLPCFMFALRLLEAGSDNPASPRPKRRRPLRVRWVRDCITPPSITVKINCPRARVSVPGGSLSPPHPETAFDRRDPTVEIDGEQFAHRRVGLMQFQRQAADRTAIAAIRHLQRAPVGAEQGEDPFDGIVHARPGGPPAAWVRCLGGTCRAPPRARPAWWGRRDKGCRVGLRFPKNVLDAGRAVTLFEEQLHGREDQTTRGGMFRPEFWLNVHSRTL